MTVPETRHDEVLDYPFVRPSALEAPPEWARLGAKCPVTGVRLPSGDHAVLVTGQQDVRTVLGDARFGRNLNADGAARFTEDGGRGPFGRETTIDKGEGHLRWRRLVSGYFTARRMTALHPAIEAEAHRLIDEMEKAGTTADLRTALAFPLPVWVICEMLGVPVADRDRFSRWSDAMLNLTRYTQAEVEQAQAEFNEYMLDLIEGKRGRDTDDLIGELMKAAEGANARLSGEELLRTCQGLLVAGHETTANMIGKMVALLLADRSRWEQLLADPSLVRTAVEEVLRYDALGGGFGLPRYVTEDLELSTTTVPAGTTVLVDIAQANRDTSVVERADELVLDRSPNPHITFGVGLHSCLGQALARTELQTVLSVLLARLPGLELAVKPEELRINRDLLVGGLAELPVRW
ncbi:cytochrome P450 [Crossiella equi]|uniref:Cytochrome P450 n=1 Tax=Crossiella equi TaxID=130796 RepID=A0ABS5ARE2_9PSEU|nr:cytochrome P450 [Crossiella equi]MBP2479133.1 cytochrome P450 [Crossiella equi]